MNRRIKPRRFPSALTLVGAAVCILAHAVSAESNATYCRAGADVRRAEFQGTAMHYLPAQPGESGDVLVIPKAATDLKASRDEFFRVLENPAVYRGAPQTDARAWRQQDLTGIHDSRRVLVNPHKGWYHYYPDSHINKNEIARDADLSWAPLQEPAVGGWVTSVAVSPHEPQRVLVGGDILGIGLSLDGGLSWLGTYGLKNWEIGDFTWHPTDPLVVWAGTMGGPCVSRDGGRNWAPSRAGFPAVNGGLYSAPIQRVRFDPNNSQRLLAFGGSHREYQTDRPGEWGAVWESTNGGSTWRRLSTVKPGGGNIMDAAFAAGRSTRIYAAVDNYGPVVSEDGGQTWELRRNGLPTDNVKDLAVHPTDPDIAVVAVWSYGASDGSRVAGGIWWTTNAGASWQARNGGIRQNSGGNDAFVTKMKSVAIAPTNPARWATSDNAYDNPGVYVTSNQGGSWTRRDARSVAMPSGGNFTCLEFSPHDANTLFAAGSEYVLRSTNGGVSWTDLSSYRTNSSVRGRGYSGWVTTRFAFHPTDPRRAMFAGLDHGFGWQSRDGLQTWTRGAGLETWMGATEIAWARNDHVFLACGQHGNFTGIARSQDGGRNFTLLHGAGRGLPEANRYDGRDPRSVYCLADNPTNVWAVIGGELFRSTNNGTTWAVQACGPDPRRMAGDPRDPRRFFVTCSDGVYEARDGGASFTRLAGSPANGVRLHVDAWGRLYVLPGRRGCAWPSCSPVLERPPPTPPT